MENLEYHTFDKYELQTRLKHKVFREYFENWVTILGSSYKIVNYIDGFAGYGVYKDKNDNIFFGSPLIAAEILNKNPYVEKAFVYLVEKNGSIFKTLSENVNIWSEENKNSKVKITIFKGKFSRRYYDILKEIKLNYPTFMLADPNGIKDMKYPIFSNFMTNFSKPEVLLNFMYNFPKRFMRTREYDALFNEMFATDEWESHIDFNNRDKFEEELTTFYKSRLKEIAKFVFPYQIYFPEKRATYYYLIHLCNHCKGAEIMKSSFAKYTHGKVVWLGKYSSQRLLTDLEEVVVEEAKKVFLSKYKGKKISFINLIEQNIDTTRYLVSHMRKAIRSLEDEEKVQIIRVPKLTKTGKTKKAIDEKCLIRFS